MDSVLVADNYPIVDTFACCICNLEDNIKMRVSGTVCKGCGRLIMAQFSPNPGFWCISCSDHQHRATEILLSQQKLELQQLQMQKWVLMRFLQLKLQSPPSPETGRDL